MKKHRILLLTSVIALMLGGCNSRTSESTSSSDPTTTTTSSSDSTSTSDTTPQVTTYTVTYQSSSDYTVTGLESSYKANDTVSFSVTVNNAAKEIKSVKKDSTTLTANAGVYSFTMPAKNVTLTITLQAKTPDYTVTYTSSADFTITGLKDSYKANESVSFAVSVTNTAKRVNTVKEDDFILTPTNTSNSYKFSMPARNVVLSVELIAKEYHFSFDQFQYELQDGVSRSEIKGAPWINANLPGQVAKIKKPSLKDDFYVATNYEDLIADNPGYIDGSQDDVNSTFSKILNDTSGKSNSRMLYKVYESIDGGSRDDIHDYLVNLNAYNFLHSKELFRDKNSFFQIEREGDYYKLSFVDGWYIGETVLPVFTASAQENPGDADTYLALRDYIVDDLDTAFNLNITSELLEQAYTFDSNLVIASKNTYETYGGFDWQRYNYGTYFLDEALTDYGLSAADTIYISRPSLAVLSSINSASTNLLKAALKLRLAFGYRFFAGLDTYKSISYYMSYVNSWYPNETDVSSYANSELYWYMTKLVFSKLVEKVYIEYTASETVKDRISDIIEQVIAMFKTYGDKYDWIDSTTRTGLMNKLNKMQYYSCYSDKIKNYPKISESDLDTISLFEVYNRYEDWLSDLDRTGAMEKSYLLTTYPSYTVNAFYTSYFNSFVIIQGILGSFPVNGTIEELLGSIGVVIGHEISHSIDENGSKFDGDGKQVNWWSSTSKAAFTKKVNKVKEFFNNITLFDDTHANGALNNTEATADMGGMHICLEIAKTINNFDYDKYFKAYSKVWLHRAYSDSYRDTMLDDEHPFCYLRVNTVVSQFEEFYETYDVGPGDAMYIPGDERIAIW